MDLLAMLSDQQPRPHLPRALQKKHYRFFAPRVNLLYCLVFYELSKYLVAGLSRGVLELLQPAHGPRGGNPWARNIYGIIFVC